MKRLLLNILKALFGISILILLMYKVGFGNIINILSAINPYYFVLGIIMAIITFVVEAFNLKLLTNAITKKVSYLKMFKYHLLSLSVSLFIPGKMGQFSLVYLLRKRGIKLGDCTVIVLLDKILTLISLSIFAIIGFFIFLPVADAIKSAVIIFLIGSVSLFFILHKSGRFFVRKFILRKYSKRFKGFSKTFKLFYTKHIFRVSTNFTITMIKMVLSALVIQFFFLAVGTRINILYVLLITPMGVIASFIPLSINGIGIRESVVVVMYSLLGINAASVVGAYLLNLLVVYFIGLISVMFFLKEFKNNAS